MMKGYFSVLINAGEYGLCCLAWGLKWVVIRPLATIMIMTLLLNWLSGSTPGQMLAMDIEKAKAGAGAGEFMVRECPPPVLPSVEDLREDICPVVVTDAAGYAGRIDRTLSGILITLWLLLALLFTVVAVFCGDMPCRRPRRIYGSASGRGTAYVTGEISTFLKKMTGRNGGNKKF
ncbi:conjugal transfer protein TraP [Salmonella enterica]|nr:conjugal transfer protein TraP [Salmonella enterica]EBY9434029.1 conjugal transfer protein TraP [Salmonella enterica subsp. enterica serovar Cerro]EIE5051086.1 conjugal transfer protein TraP [Salmonella enterica subsp. enterica serovar Java]EBR6515272.1 conjugal transfer protein TraP [Salmonella enterica]EDZ9225438.1 conjugal transfer protein TraP [Salmonella enterica]